MKRHSELRVRKPENVSTARAAATNETVLMNWFANNKAIVQKLGIEDMPERFWNHDETSLQCQFDQGLVVAKLESHVIK